MRYFAVLLTVTAASAQWTVITDAYSAFYDRAPAMASGPSGDIWIGGELVSLFGNGFGPEPCP
jgi:hypothetical protein